MRGKPVSGWTYRKADRAEPETVSKYQIIEVKNPVEWEVEIEKIGQYTSKKEGEDHGLGLLNVIETVERNGGTIKFASEKGIFRVLIQLKSGRKEKERNSERG